MGRVARLLGWRCIKRSLIYLVARGLGRAAKYATACPTLARSFSLSLSYVSLRTFQESDAEKSDQDLVVDVANEVRHETFIKKDLIVLS